MNPHDWCYLGQTDRGWPRFRCRACHLAVTICSGEPAVMLAGMAECRGLPEASLPQFRPRRRIRRYVSAVSAWIAAGRPVRIPKEVAKIYDESCRPCPDFKADSCRICGCRVRRNGKALANKIRMGTEHCPAGRW